MRILVITSDPRWVAAIRAAFPGDYDVMPGDPRHVGGLRPLLGVVDACFVAEAELGTFTIEILKQLTSGIPAPIFAVADTVRPDWEEAALIAGARQVFRAPLRSGVVQLTVSRARVSPGMTLPTRPPEVQAPVAAREGHELALFREFTRLLALPAREREFVAAFVVTLRERIGCGRMILCLPEPGASGTAFQLATATGFDGRQLENFRIRLDQGLGRLVNHRGGAVLRDRLRSEQPDEVIAAREMDVFGAEMAVPLNGREGCAGLLLVGPRITGTAYSEQEVTLLYHVMAEFAEVLIHTPASTPGPASKPVLPALLDALPIGCALLDRSLRILQANDELRSQLGRESTNPMGIDRLPAMWRETISAVIQKQPAGAQVELNHEFSGAIRYLRVTLRPLPAEASSPEQWLMVTEDITNETRLRQEMHEHGIHNVLQRAGEHLSNEFRNALTPIEVLVQLSGESHSGRRDIDRLRTPVSLAIHRLRRRIDNLGYLTKSAIVAELTTVTAVFRSARDRLDQWVEPKQLKTLVWSGEFSKVAFTADAAAVGLALAELVLNAIEAAEGGQVTITAEDLPEAVNFKVRNPGEWAPPNESSGFGHRPFMTAKSTGVGLGVEVATRVAEFHGGRLVLGPVSPNTVEAIFRIPRNLPALPTSFETPVAKAL